MHAQERISDNLSLYAREIERYPLLDRATERELIAKAQSGDVVARNTLVTSNLRFVVTVAHKFFNGSVPLLDLVEAGNLGLFQAIDRFDLTRLTPECKPPKFITYAVHWIKVNIQWFLQDSSRPTYIPAHHFDYLTKVAKAQRVLTVRLGRWPTEEEILKYTGLKPNHVAKAFHLMTHVESFDEIPLGDHEPFGASFKDASVDVEALIEGSTFKQDVLASLWRLTARERTVIVHYFGLEDNEPKTLYQIAPLLGLTGERIRQIRDGALTKLKRDLTLREYANVA